MSNIAETEYERLSTNAARYQSTALLTAQALPKKPDLGDTRQNDISRMSHEPRNSEYSIHLATEISPTSSAQATKSEISKSFLDHRLIPFPAKAFFHNSFVALQKWEGVVKSVSDDTFLAHLTDSVDENRPVESAVFSMNDVQDDEKDFVRPGAVFIVTIGYHLSKSRQRTRQTHVLFRTLPVWQEKDIEKARLKAKRLL